MNKRQMGKMMRGAFTLSALSLSAANLTLVGDGTAVWIARRRTGRMPTVKRRAMRTATM